MNSLIKTNEFRAAYKTNVFLQRQMLLERLLKVATGEFVTNKTFALEKFLYFKNSTSNCDLDTKIQVVNATLARMQNE